MRSMRVVLWFMLCGALVVITGCHTIPPPPPTYVQTSEPGWRVIDLREDLRFEDAWQLLVDSIRKKYDIEIVDKDSGYLRTGWMYTSGGTPRSDYKTRVTIKFSPDKRKLELKGDAMYHKLEYGATGGMARDHGWFPGTDTELLNDAYGDISALVGRVRR